MLGYVNPVSHCGTQLTRNKAGWESAASVFACFLASRRVPRLFPFSLFSPPTHTRALSLVSRLLAQTRKTDRDHLEEIKPSVCGHLGNWQVSRRCGKDASWRDKLGFSIKMAAKEKSKKQKTNSPLLEALPSPFWGFTVISWIAGFYKMALIYIFQIVFSTPPPQDTAVTLLYIKIRDGRV